eukprot:Nitzschia sp. Nitz4//scaffold48_size128905//19149//20978//NITZ4_003580-RA/size128905-processed-gene-0.72-mRNA-1//1//CDS//3329552922//4950//frame0
MNSSILLTMSRRLVRTPLCTPSATVSFAPRNAKLGLAWYSSTLPAFEEEEQTEPAGPSKAELRKIALEYGRRKAAYNRHVKQLRREYMEEYQRHQQEDAAQQEAERAEITRRRLERQRVKNERSVQNAIRQLELRRQNQLAFEDHLIQEQEKRDAKKELYLKAQQLLIDELEQEAPMWLTTAEEVEAAFTPEAEQLLWARPHGVLGVPNPSLDSQYWQYETHTWQMNKTYKTQQDILLEEMEEEVYNSTNVDPEFWTPERIQAQEELEEKAKLRANVRTEGRLSLLKRQQKYLDEENETQEGEPPKPEPVPSLGVLANIKAQEAEGAEALFKDPTKFFVFDAAAASSTEAAEGDEGYSGPALGAPVGIRDPLRSGSFEGRVFPRAVGKMPKPDQRTEKEKKRQEREERLWAAAQAQARSDKDQIDLAADEDADLGVALDYDDNEGWDSDDEEWMKGLDPDLDSKLVNMPHEYRYREEDVDWVIERLEQKAKSMENHVRNTVNSMEQELRSRRERRDTEQPEEAETSAVLDEETKQKLVEAGADVAKYEALLLSLSEDQLLSLFALGANKRDTEEASSANVFDSVADLTDEQRAGLTEMEEIMQRIENKN